MGKYSIGEFAKKTQHTVRTLRYYDEIGLLKPAYVTESGRRMYSDKEFVTLQKIVTLKYLGFTLEQIKEYIDQDRWHLKESLSVQKQIMLEQKKQIEHVLKGLDHALNIVDAHGEVDADILITLIQGIQLENVHKEFLKQFIDEEKVESLYKIPQEKQFELEKEMFATTEKLKKYIGTDPEQKEVQVLIEKLIELMEEVIGDLSFLEGFNHVEDLQEEESFLFHSPFNEEEEEWLRKALIFHLKKRGIEIDE